MVQDSGVTITVTNRPVPEWGEYYVACAVIVFRPSPFASLRSSVPFALSLSSPCSFTAAGL